MAINVTCTGCQKGYSVPDQHAGKRFKCKQCGQPIQVPAAASEDDDDDFLKDLSEATTASRRSAPLPSLPPLPSQSARPQASANRKKAKSSSGSGNGPSVGKVIGIVFACFVGLGGLGIVVRVAATSSLSKDVAKWHSVPFDRGMTVKMPGKPKPKTIQTPDGPIQAKIFGRLSLAWMASTESWGLGADEVLEFDRDGAELARLEIANEILSRPQVQVATPVGAVEQINGHWAFRINANVKVERNKGTLYGYFVLLPTKVVHLEYVDATGTDQAAADRFFATLTVPPAENQSQVATPEDFANNSGGSHDAAGYEDAMNEDAMNEESMSNESVAEFNGFSAPPSGDPEMSSNVTLSGEAGSAPTMTPEQFEGFPSDFEFPEGEMSNGPPPTGGFNPLSFLPPAPPARPQDAVSYQQFRESFNTQLTQRGPAPQPFDDTPMQDGIRKLTYESDGLQLHGYEYRGDASSRNPKPAILFLHGGFASDPNEILVIKPFLDAGFVGFAPTYRGENGNPGEFSLFFNESTDAANAARWLASRRYVDKDHIYCIGHSAGGGIATLLSLIEDVPLRSTASVGGLYSPEAFQPGMGLPLPFTPSDDETRARTLFGNTPDMLRPHTAYIGLLDLPMITSVGQINADIAVNGGRQPLFKAEYIGGDHFASFEPAMLKYLAECQSDLNIDPQTTADPPAGKDRTNPFRRK